MASPQALPTLWHFSTAERGNCMVVQLTNCSSETFPPSNYVKPKLELILASLRVTNQFHYLFQNSISSTKTNATDNKFHNLFQKFLRWKIMIRDGSTLGQRGAIAPPPQQLRFSLIYIFVSPPLKYLDIDL